MFKNAERRLHEEYIYEAVAIEIDKGVRRQGLWAKAFAKSKGDENITKAHYIELRVQAMRDEMEVFAKELNEKERAANASRSSSAPLPLAPNMQEISNYCKSHDTFMIIRVVKKLGYNVTTLRPDKESPHETFRVEKPSGDIESFIGTSSFISFIQAELLEG